MKRTRRAALAMLAGSSGLFAMETLAYSQSSVDRDVTVDIVDDADAYLGLVEKADGEEVETDGVIFEDDGDRYPPATFTVKNQLTEDVSVTLSLGTNGDDEQWLRFLGSDDTDSDYLVAESKQGGETIEPGHQSELIEIDLDITDGFPTLPESLSSTLEIEAKGELARVEAKRTITLSSGILCDIDFDFGRLLIRKRTYGTDKQADEVVLECIERDGTSTVLKTIETTVLPSLRLVFTDVRSGSGSTIGPSIETATDVTAAVELVDRDSGPQSEGSDSPEPSDEVNESATDPRLVVDIQSSGRAISSTVDEFELSLEELRD